MAALEAIYTDADESQKIRLLDLLLDAQRQLADAESQFHRSLAEYMVAVKNVHYEKGSLLDYNQIHLAEGLWPTKAYADASNRLTDYTTRRPLAHLPHLGPAIPVVTAGTYPQDLEPATNPPLDLEPTVDDRRGGATPIPSEFVPAPLPDASQSEERLPEDPRPGRTRPR